MSTQRTRTDWVEWLIESRNISIPVIIEAKLEVDTMMQELSIPVFGPYGDLLFYKYRRSPWTEGGSKYRYEAGSTAALYGAELLKKLDPSEDIVITEGELDALALRSLGQSAVSSTGGSGTWKEEWSALCAPHNPIVCYDTDNAGVEGALRVAMTFPEGVRIAWLPPQYGKDPTEIIASDAIAQLKAAIYDARVYKVPARGTSNRLTALSALGKQLHTERVEEMRSRDGTPFHRDLALAWVEKEIKAEKEVSTYQGRGPVSGEMASRLEAARTYPIGKLIKVSREGFASCPFHEEKTASFKVYKDNHGYCFGGCGKRFDAIDIYAKMNNIDLKEKGAFKRVTDALI